MIEDLANGVLDYVDQVPFTAADAVKKHANLTLNVGPGSEVTNLIINSNPLKTKNRELLDPKVKEALEYAIPREQIVEVVFGGYAKPWANILSRVLQGRRLAEPRRAAAPIRHRQGERDPRRRSATRAGRTGSASHPRTTASRHIR